MTTYTLSSYPLRLTPDQVKYKLWKEGSVGTSFPDVTVRDPSEPPWDPRYRRTPNLEYMFAIRVFLTKILYKETLSTSPYYLSSCLDAKTTVRTLCFRQGDSTFSKL